MLKTTFLLCFVFCSVVAFSQDIENSHDHAMISRMNNFIIGEFEQNFDRVEMLVSEEDVKQVEGDKTYLYYYWDETKGQYPSLFQIVKNHDNAIKRIGGRVVYYDGQGQTTYNIRKNGADVWVKLQAVNQGEAYYLTIVEVNNLRQEISASDLYQAITNDGSVALYINFDTGKSVLKGDADPVVSQVAQMLLENPGLKVSVEGHTDNVGNAAANKALSVSRAKAVVQALIAKGVPATRLSSTGWGQEKPLADNTSEEGRAKNRRVEIVKK